MRPVSTSKLKWNPPQPGSTAARTLAPLWAKGRSECGLTYGRVQTALESK